MRLKAAVTLLFIASAPLACDQRSDTPPPAARAREEHSKARRSASSPQRLAEASGPGQAAAAAASTDQGPSKVTALENMAASRKLVRTGQLSIEVASYQKAAQEVTRLVESLGGYLADSRSLRSANGQEQGTLTLRLPAERFAQCLFGLSALGTVRSQNVSAQDVTKAYTDLETRLRVKRDTAERLREILKVRTAGLADVLQAERELARVTEEIEQMEGERRFFDQQVALSTLTVELAEPHAIVKTGSLPPLRRALEDSLELLSASVAALIYVTVFLAPWLLVAGGVWLAVRAIRARRRHAKLPPSA